MSKSKIDFFVFFACIILAIVPWIIDIDSFNQITRIFLSLAIVFIFTAIYLLITLNAKNKKLIDTNLKLENLTNNRDAINVLLKERTDENDLLKNRLITSIQIINSFEQSLINASAIPTKEEKHQIINLHSTILNYKKFLEEIN